RSDATAHGLNLALVLGAERIISLDLGDVRHAPLSRRDAVLTPAPAHVDRSTPERPVFFPVSSRVLTLFPIDGNTSDAPCCHAIELQAVHASPCTKIDDAWNRTGSVFRLLGAAGGRGAPNDLDGVYFELLLWFGWLATSVAALQSRPGISIVKGNANRCAARTESSNASVRVSKVSVERLTSRESSCRQIAQANRLPAGSRLVMWTT